MSGPDAPITRRQAWTLVVVATLTMTVSYVDRQTLAVLAPSFTAALGISDAEYGWLASAFSIAYLVGAPVAGELIDRVGARRGLLVAVLVWSAVSALHALVPGFGVLFALRIALGVAEAPAFPSAAQTVHRVLPPRERGRAIGILFTGSSIGAMIAPPLAAACAERFGWRTAFLVTSAVGLCWVPAWIAVAWRGPARAWLDHRPAKVPSAPEARLIDVASHRAVLRGMVLVFASAPGLAFLLLWPAKFLVHQYGLTQAEVGLYLWFPPLVFDLGSVIFGDLASRRDRARGQDGEPHRLLVGVSAALECAIVMVPLAGSPSAAMAFAGIAMAGGGGMFALATHDMLGRVPSGVVSRAGGMTAASQSLAYVIANPLIGAMVQRFGSYEWAAIGLGAWVIPGTILWLLWPAPPLQAVLHEQSPAT